MADTFDQPPSLSSDTPKMNPYEKYVKKEANPYAKYAKKGSNSPAGENPSEGSKNDDEKFTVTELSGKVREPDAFERGGWKAAVSAGQILNKIGVGGKIGVPSDEKLAKDAKQLKKQGEGKGFLSSIGETAGNPANAAALMFPEGKLGNLAAGALMAASDPTTEDGDNYGYDKLKQMGGGAIEGLFGGEAMRALGKVASPVFSKSVDFLRKEGVEMTPGTLASGMLKGAVKRGESALASIPVLGSFIQSAENRSIESFNQAVANRVLKPLGEKLPDTVKAGRAMVDYVKTKVGDAYDKLLPHLSFQLDSIFADGVKQLKETVVSRLPPESQKHVASLFESIVGSRLEQGGGKLDGKMLKIVDSELAYESRTYMKAQDPAQRRVGEAIDGFRDLFKENLARMNPKYAKQLNDTNAAWAAYIRMRDASVRTVKSGEREIGVFSPVDLLREIKSKTSKGAFASGNGLMQDLAEAGSQVLPETVRDSGSVERGLWALIASGGGAAITGHPGAAVGGAVGAIPYTQPGMTALNKWAQSEGSPALRKALESMAPVAATGAANVPLLENSD